MKVEFPIIIEHEGSDWFASTPDLPGCFATGNGLEQIIRNARRAISLHVLTLTSVPSPSNFSDIDSDGNKVVLVDIDI